LGEKVCPRIDSTGPTVDHVPLRLKADRISRHRLHLSGCDRCDHCHAVADDQYFGRSGARRLGPGPLASQPAGPTPPCHTGTGDCFRPWETQLPGAAIRRLRDVGYSHQAPCHLRVGTKLEVTSSTCRRPDRRSGPLVRTVSGYLSTPIELDMRTGTVDALPSTRGPRSHRQLLPEAVGRALSFVSDQPSVWEQAHPVPRSGPVFRGE